MEAPMYSTVATTSRSWWRRRWRRMCSMIGRPATGTSGLGMLLVRGRRREPSPPAMTTAFIPLPQIGSYARAGRTESIRPRPALDVAAANREPVPRPRRRALEVDTREPRAPAQPARRGRGREGDAARRGPPGPRGRTRGVPRVLRPPPPVHGRAGPTGHRLLLARVRAVGVPAHLLRRPRGARRRPPEGDERPRPPARRRGAPLPAGIRSPGHRPGRTPVRGLRRKPGLGAAGEQGRGRGG